VLQVSGSVSGLLVDEAKFLVSFTCRESVNQRKVSRWISLYRWHSSYEG
jgi:hypothetical protein